MIRINVETYWQWAVDSESDNRPERIRAEQSVEVYVEAIEQVRQSPELAIALLDKIISWPDEFNEWHARKVAFGILEEAIQAYGNNFLAADVFATSRGAMVASLL